MRPKHAKDLSIAALAGDQHGVVSRAQLLTAGFTNEDMARLVRARRLHRLHRGVYAVGHRVVAAEGRWMAAVLATGGVLSHATAAAAWDLRRTSAGLIHVTVAGETGRAHRRGLRVHRASR